MRAIVGFLLACSPVAPICAAESCGDEESGSDTESEPLPPQHADLEARCYFGFESGLPAPGYAAVQTDFDSEGEIDLVSIGDDGALLLQRGREGGGLADRVEVAAGAPGVDVLLPVDVDLDGIEDLLAVFDSELIVYLGDGAGGLAAGTTRSLNRSDRVVPAGRCRRRRRRQCRRATRHSDVGPRRRGARRDGNTRHLSHDRVRRRHHDSPRSGAGPQQWVRIVGVDGIEIARL